jgi:uroporphyrin-III C-methyltransferase
VSVSLVGAGPGDPGLITVRGLERVRSCDVLVFDRLVSPELVAEAPQDSLRIARDPLSQEQINELLVGYGRAGLDVVRLKGGDPFVFGRGGEEAVALASAGVPFEVVAGVSALSAVPGAAGIPITHRGLASEVTLLAAHDPDRLDYERLARSPGTLVLFMGLSRLPRVARGLIDAGMDPQRPAAIVAGGTTPEQEAVRGALCEIAELAAHLPSPALAVVGNVVELADLLAVARPRLLAETAL